LEKSNQISLKKMVYEKTDRINQSDKTKNPCKNPYKTRGNFGEKIPEI